MGSKVLGSPARYGYADLSNMNEKQADELYKDGGKTFSESGRINKAKGFFMESVGGKVLNQKFGKAVSIPDVEAENGRLRFTRSHPQKISGRSRGDEAMEKFGDLMKADEKTDDMQFDD